MAGLPHSNSHTPGRHLALLSPGPTPAQTALSGVDKMWFQAPLLPFLPGCSTFCWLGRRGQDTLITGTQDIKPIICPGTWTAGFLGSPAQSSQNTHTSHPSASLCHTAFALRARSMSSLSVPGHLSLQPAKRTAKKGKLLPALEVGSDEIQTVFQGNMLSEKGSGPSRVIHLLEISEDKGFWEVQALVVRKVWFQPQLCL